jgi:ribose/xylose/arabinose/galactoside ABC-type transport system permease subunit
VVEIMERSRGYRDTAREAAKRFLGHENAVLAIILVVLVLGMGAVTKWLSVSRTNVMNVLLESSIRGVASIGQAFVILAGCIDISLAGVGLLSASMGAVLMTGNKWQNIASHPYPVYVGIPIMLLVGAVLGLANGSLVSRVRIPSIIVTLAMWQITWGLAYQVIKGQAIVNLPESLSWWGMGRVAAVPVPIIIFIAVAVVAYFVLQYTTFGRSVYAAGGSPVGAWLSGISVKNTQLIVYIISGFLAGLVAVTTLGRTMVVMTQTLVGLELDTIASVVVGGVSLSGGKGNLIGVII